MNATDEPVVPPARDLAENLSATEAASQVAEKILYRSWGRDVPLVGLNGAQGSGKSTLAALVAEALARRHAWRTVTLSLDDFYLTKGERERLARDVHPLCATRGVPGTHDIALMIATIDRLANATPSQPTLLPRFDKLADDRRPVGDWQTFIGRPEAILLEGWCVGVRTKELPAYDGPINALEQAEDSNGAWFAWSLETLAAYEPMWDRIGLLVSIEVPDLETVIESRLRQEEELAVGTDAPRMDRAAVVRFVEHYERYTRALWGAMRGRADILFRRDCNFGFKLVEERP